MAQALNTQPRDDKEPEAVVLEPEHLDPLLSLSDRERQAIHQSLQASTELTAHGCPMCRCAGVPGLGIPEPVWTLESAAYLVPMTQQAIRRWIRTYRDKLTQPPVYIKVRIRNRTQYVRALRLRDLWTLRREYVVEGPYPRQWAIERREARRRERKQRSASARAADAETEHIVTRDNES